MALLSAYTAATAYWTMTGSAGATENDQIAGTAPQLSDVLSSLGVGSTIFGRTATRAVVTDATHYFVANAHADFALGDVDMSLRMLVRFNALATFNHLCSVRNSVDRAFQMYGFSDGLIYCDASSGAGSTGSHTVDSTPFGTCLINTDYHVVLTYNKTTDILALYVNGVGNTVAHASGLFSNVPNLYVGRDPTSNQVANVSVSEIIVVQGYCMTATDVLTDYHSGVPLSFSTWVGDTGTSGTAAGRPGRRRRRMGRLV